MSRMTEAKSFATYFIGLCRHHILIRDLFQSSREHRMVTEDKLLSLLSGDLDFPCVRNNNVVATVD